MGQKKRYPAVMQRWPHPPRVLTSDEFVTQQDAAERLGVSLLSVGRLIAEGRLLPGTCNGELGVELASMEAERSRRTGRLWRPRSFVKSLWHWASP